MKVYFSPIAEDKLLKLCEYLLAEWGQKAKKDFLYKLDKKIIQISRYPESSTSSNELGGIYKCVVTKQTTMYYRIQHDAIEVITFFDNRQNPDKLDEFLK